MENYGYALEDASKAIENDRKYIKVQHNFDQISQVNLVSLETSH